MKVHRESRYLMLARIAYATFFGKSAQVSFNDLSYEYQAKWIAVAKAITQARIEPEDPLKVFSHEAAAAQWTDITQYLRSKGESDTAWLARLPKRGSRINLQAIGPELAKEVKRIQHVISESKKKKK